MNENSRERKELNIPYPELYACLLIKKELVVI